jgi:hypothetical protein
MGPMPPRWNTWAGIQAVQFDWEKAPKDRQVRLAAPTARVGDPVRIRMSGAEIEAVITDASTPVLRVKIKPAAVKAGATKTKRTRTA